MPSLATERLCLRRLTDSDVHILLRMEADPEVMRFLAGGAIPPSQDRMASLIEHASQIPGPMGHWVICRENETLGWISLTPLDGDGRVQLAYRLVRSAWGHGYATEAAVAIVRHGFSVLKLLEIVAVVRQENAASIGVLKKLAFKLDTEQQSGEYPTQLFTLNAGTFDYENP